MTGYYQPYWIESSDELEHHGILGMKWGVRRYQNADGSLTSAGEKRYNKPTKEERLKTRDLKRQTAAAIKNLKEKGDTYSETEANVLKAKEAYARANSKMYLFKKNRRNAIKQASENLTAALELAERPRAERVRAQEIYNETAKKLLDNNKKMIEKYGSDSIKKIGTKMIEYGITDYKSGLFTDEYLAFQDKVLNTGLTVVDIPWYGQRYTGRYVVKQEEKIREREFDKTAGKKY